MRSTKLLPFLTRQDLLRIKELALSEYRDKAIHKDETDDAYLARSWVEAFASLLLQERIDVVFMKEGEILCQLHSK